MATIHIHPKNKEIAQQIFQSVRILIITSCTKNKVKPNSTVKDQHIQIQDLWDEGTDDRTQRNFGRLEMSRLPAGELYKGRQHIHLMQGVHLLRQEFGESAVYVKIISAGFGLVDEKQSLPLYDATFTGLQKANISVLAQRLRIPSSVNQLISEKYTCIFFLLGSEYLSALNLPFEQIPTAPCLFLMGPSNQKQIPNQKSYHCIQIGQNHGKEFGANLIELKGKLFKYFVQQIIETLPNTTSKVFSHATQPGERLQTFLDNPTIQCFLDIVAPFQKNLHD